MCSLGQGERERDSVQLLGANGRSVCRVHRAALIMSKLGEAEQLFATFRAAAEKGDIEQAKVGKQSAANVSGDCGLTP